MAGPPELAARYYGQQKTIVGRVLEQLALLWTLVDPNNLDASLLALRDQVTAAIAAGQVAAAQRSVAYLASVLDTTNTTPAAALAVAPAAFGGTSQDGFDVGNVVTLAAIATKARIARGATPDAAIRMGFNRAVTFVRDEVQDAGRESLGVANLVEPKIVAYERHVNLPACGRCLILAGNRYRKSTGFLRHPNDDCTMVPITADQAKKPVGSTLSTSPTQLLDKMTDAQKQKALGGADALEAYKSGADVSALVNAQRGMARPGAQFTAEGTTSRSLFAQRNNLALEKKPGARYRIARQQRLSPAGCRMAAGGDQEKYVQLLKANAYIS